MVHDERARELSMRLRDLDDERGAANERLQALKVELARGAEHWEALKRAAARAEKERAETGRQIEETGNSVALLKERSAAADGGGVFAA